MIRSEIFEDYYIYESWPKLGVLSIAVIRSKSLGKYFYIGDSLPKFEGSTIVVIRYRGLGGIYYSGDLWL